MHNWITVVALLFIVITTVYGSLATAKASLDKLAVSVKVLKKNEATNTFPAHILSIVENLAKLAVEVDAFSAEDFDKFISYKSDPKPAPQETITKLEVFELIMKLLYVQSSRDRQDFTSAGAPSVRMYAFGLLIHILRKFETDDERKDYIAPSLTVDQTKIVGKGIYSTADEIKKAFEIQNQKNVKDEEIVTKQDPGAWGGPFVEALETIESQIFNFYYIWNFETDNPQIRRRYRRPLAAKPNEGIMLLTIHNMLSLLDWILSLDDDELDHAVDENPGAYIAFFESSRVYDILGLIATVDFAPNDVDPSNIKKYFDGKAEDSDPDVPEPLNRKEAVSLALDNNINFKVFPV